MIDINIIYIYIYRYVFNTKNIGRTQSAGLLNILSTWQSVAASGNKWPGSLDFFGPTRSK